MFETDAGARRPWPGGGFAKARNRSERGDGDHVEDDEKWQWREKRLGLTPRSLFNSSSNEGHTTVHWIVPKIMDRWPELP
jgi:hypothetical protein